MAFRKQSPERMQRSMFNDEMQFGREQGAMQEIADDNVYFHQKEGNDDLTRWQQDLKEEVDMTIHDLRREYQDEEGDWQRMVVPTEKTDDDGNKVYRYEEPLMNELGVNMFKATMRPLISRNLIMSNYDEQRIYTKLRSVVITFINHIAYCHKRYGINIGNLSVIVRLFKDIAEPAHWRCLNNGERSYLNTINKRVEAFAYGGNQQGGQQKKNFLSGLIS